jgi:hypothetical protein
VCLNESSPLQISCMGSQGWLAGWESVIDLVPARVFFELVHLCLLKVCYAMLALKIYRYTVYVDVMHDCVVCLSQVAEVAKNCPIYIPPRSPNAST